MRPKSEIYTRKRDDEHPHPFHIRSPPRENDHSRSTLRSISKGVLERRTSWRSETFSPDYLLFLDATKFIMMLTQKDDLVDLLENLVKIKAQVCKKSTSGWRTSLKKSLLSFNASVNSSCAQPTPSPSLSRADPRAFHVFFCLGWQIPGGWDSWAVKSPGVGTKKEGKRPVHHQNCSSFHIA